MPFSLKKSQSEFAKMMAAACVRRGYLEKLHSGFTPVTRSGDYSDVLKLRACQLLFFHPPKSTVFSPGSVFSPESRLLVRSMIALGAPVPHVKCAVPGGLQRG